MLARALPLAAAEALIESVGVSEAHCEALALSQPLREWVPLPVPLAQSLLEMVGVAQCEGEMLPQPLALAVRLGLRVLLEHPVTLPLREPDTDAVALALTLMLRLPQVEGEGEGEVEREAD